ncbi:MAG: AMP-binding protein [Spirochaetales bacterium]|nr:AMP-binding protein [Spirochaetales bacterium]
MKRTIIQMLNLSKERYGSKGYLFDKDSSGWNPTTFEKTFEESHYVASSLIGLGIKSEDKVAIISEAKTRWILLELGTILIGAISVPLSIKLLSEEIPFRINHSDSKIIAVSKITLEKVLKVFDQFENKNIKILFFDDDIEFAQNLFIQYKIPFESHFISYFDFIKSGKDNFEKNRSKIENLKEKVEENSVANICYTSGTTGNPKGIMLTHLNYWSNCHDSIELFKVPDDFKTLVILPIDHSFAHTVAIYAGLLRGIQLYFVDYRDGTAGALKNIPINILESNPNFLLTVPALSGNFMKKIIDGIEGKGKIINFIFKLGLSCGIKYNGNAYNRPSILTRIINYIPYKFADTLIFKKIRKIFGKDIQFFVGGGALLDVKQQQFFYTIGVPVYQGYGLTEAAPVISSNTPNTHKLGSSGIIAPSVQCKIILEDGKEAKVGQRGQIVIKGENVMKGYYKNKEETEKTIKDGWLYTGDLGYFDEDGFLIVVGREKALLISEDGEKYSPEEIEEAIVNSSEFIYQVMIYNDHKKFTTSLITLNVDKLKSFLKQREINEPNKILDIIYNDFQKYSNDSSFKDKFPKKWQPSTFMIVEEPFSEANHMINSTMKMVRYKITENYREKLEYMYKSEGMKYNNEENKKVLERLLK